MILSDTSIKKAIKDKRIVINPYSEKDVQPASVDVHLSNTILIFKNSVAPYIDLKDEIPDLTEDLSSLASDIEDLELIVFQKDQKIKFRDGQINNLKIQLQDNKAQLENTIKELDNIKGLYAAIISSNDNSVPLDDLNILQDKFNALNKENEKNIVEINNLNNQIKDLDNNLLSVDQNQKDVKIENQKLKQENKSLFAKNLKLNETISNLENEINEQRIEIEMYLEKIKELKDKSHHGG